MTLFNIFQAEGHQHIEIKSWGLEKSELHGNGIFFLIAIGVFPVELLACQVSLFSALQIGQDISMYNLNIILG